jgi:hypothetical protein
MNYYVAGVALVAAALAAKCDDNVKVLTATFTPVPGQGCVPLVLQAETKLKKSNQDILVARVANECGATQELTMLVQSDLCCAANPPRFPINASYPLEQGKSVFLLCTVRAWDAAPCPGPSVPPSPPVHRSGTTGVSTSYTPKCTGDQRCLRMVTGPQRATEIVIEDVPTRRN